MVIGLQSPFEGVLGNNCELRVLEYLLPLGGIDFNVSELAEDVGVSRPTATRVLKKFVEHGIMKESRSQGQVVFYELDPRSPFVRLMENLNNLLIEEMLGEEMLNEIHEMWEGHARKAHDDRPLSPNPMELEASSEMEWPKPSQEELSYYQNMGKECEGLYNAAG